jgi:hypothetical protein
MFSLGDYGGGGGSNEGGGGMAVLDAAPLILAYTNIFLHAFCPAGSRS